MSPSLPATLTKIARLCVYPERGGYGGKQTNKGLFIKIERKKSKLGALGVKLFYY